MLVELLSTCQSFLQLLVEGVGVCGEQQVLAAAALEVPQHPEDVGEVEVDHGVAAHNKVELLGDLVRHKVVLLQHYTQINETNRQFCRMVNVHRYLFIYL